MLKDLFTVIESSSHTIMVKFTSEDHPLFKAHFPNYPILAGFLQIDVILSIIKEEIKILKYAKFIKHIYPNDIIEYKIKKDCDYTTIQLLKDNKKISEIKYESQ